MLNDKEMQVQNAELSVGTGVTWMANENYWTKCASVRQYFLISRIIEKISDNNMITEPFCIVEHEDIAIDFCEKNPQFTYTREEAIYYGD